MTRTLRVLAFRFSRRRLFPAATVGLALLLMSAATGAQAATITVTSNATGTGGSGDCTLREAIQAANTDTAVDGCTAGSGADIILFCNCTLTLTSPFTMASPDGPIGLPDITSDITIQGKGPGISIIERLTSAADFSIFRVTAGGRLRLENLTLRNGRNLGGGAIINRGGQVELSIVDVLNNRATGATGVGGGGAIVNFSPGMVILNGANFDGNSALAGPGGAIRNESTLGISNSNFTNNTAATIGGAIDTFVPGAPVTINATSFLNNTAIAFGGAVHHHASPLTITNSGFFSNTAGSFTVMQAGGGAIEGFGPWTISDTVFNGNLTFSFNVADGGALRYIGDSMMVSRCTFSNNTAQSRGGAIELNGVASPNIRVINSTLSANSANGAGGGGIDLQTGSVELNNLTIANNNATQAGGVLIGSGATSFISRNTIIAQNTAETPQVDCFTEAPAVFTSQGHNLIGDRTGCTIPMIGVGDQIGTVTTPAAIDPLLGPLRGNGGPTQTRALRPVSPAVDAGDLGTPGSGGTACEATDQRGAGFNRPVGLACDIGAFEGTLPRADLAITVMDSPDPVAFGSNVTFTTTVTNNGPDTAPDVFANHTLGLGFDAVSAVSTQGMCTINQPSSGDQVDCDIGVMSSGTVVTITAVATAIRSGQQSTTARVFSSMVHDPTPANNITSPPIGTYVTRDGDLVLSKSGPTRAIRNTNFNYSLFVENRSSTSATNVTITDPLPAGVAFVSSSPAVCSAAGQNVTCNLGTIVTRGFSFVTLTVTAPAATGNISNTATVAGAEADPDGSNNSATANTLVVGVAALVVTKTDSPDPVPTGSNVTYTFNVTNNGPDPATSVSVTDMIPFGSTFVSVNSTLGSCTPDLNLPVCNVPTLNNGATATVTVVVRADFPCILNNQARVSWAENASPLSVLESTTVGPAVGPDLRITKSHIGNFTIGVQDSYTISIANVGAGATTGAITVTDTLPAQLAFVIGTGTNWACSAAGQNVTCTHPGPVAPAGSAPALTITVRVLGPAGLVSNTANVSTAGDANAANDSATDPTQINAFGCTKTAVASDNWNNPAIWNPAGVPTATDNVCIPAGFTVTLDTAQNIRSLSMDGTLNMTAGSLTFTVSSQMSGTFNLSGGTLVGSSADMTLNGPWNWSGGTVTGGAQIHANGNVALSGVGKTISGHAVNLNGSNTWTAGDVQMSNSGTWNILPSGTLDVRGNLSVTNGGGIGVPAMNIAGTFMKSSSAGTATVNVIFNNLNSVQVQMGTLSLAGGGTHSGSFNVSFPVAAFLDFAGGTHDLTGTSSVSGGTVSFNGGTTNFAGSYSITGNTNINAGTANFNASASTDGGTLAGGGTLGGSGTLTITGTFTWTSGGGTMSGTGNTVLSPSSTFFISGSGIKFLSQRTLTTQGSTTWFGTEEIRAGNGAMLNNSGTFTVNGDASFTNGLGGAAVSFNNSGTFTKSPGTGTTSFSGVAFNNSGTVNVTTGTLALNGGGTHSGSFAIDATLRFGGGTHTVNTGATFTGIGVFVMDGATVNFPGTVTVAAFSQLISGTLGGAGTVTFNSLVWVGGTMSGTGTTVVGASGLSISGGPMNLSRTLSNTTTALWSSGTINGTSGVLQNQAGASFQISGSVSFLMVTSPPAFNNAGTFTLSNVFVTATFGSGVSFNNTGTINLGAGNTLAMQGTFTQTAGSTNLFSASSISGGTTLNINGGTLTGTGTITGNVSNAGGMVAPGVSPGTLNITGNYTQSATGSLNIELAGTGAGQFDVLAITGSATLNGTLNVNSFGGFTPMSGNMFQIMTFGSRTGDFATKNNNANATLNLVTSTPANTSYVVLFQTAGCDVTSAQSGDWAVNSTWVGGVVPTATQNVCVVSNHVVTVTTAQSANSLTVTSTAVFIISGGSLSLASASSIGAGGFTQSSGTLSGAGALTVSGLFTWTGGTQDGGGITNANGAMSLTNATLRARTVNLAGASTFTTAFRINHGQGGVINNSGTVNVSEGSTVFNQGGTPGVINNSGTFNRSPGTAAADIDMAVNNSGTVSSTSGGTMSLNGGGTSTGNFSASGTSAVAFGGGTHNITLGMASSFSGAGTILFSGATVNLGGTGSYNVTGTTSVTGGTVNFNAAASTNVLMQSSGTVGGTGTLSASGLFTWTGGSQSGAGTTNANGGMSISGGSLQRALVNNGNAALTGNWDITSPGTLSNPATRNFNIQGDFNITGTGTINSSGTFRKVSGSVISSVAPAVNNSGTVSLSSGGLALNGGGTSSGTFSAPGGQLDFGGGTFDLGASSNIAGNGIVRFLGGTVNLNGAYGPVNDTQVFGGTVNFNTTSPATPITFSVLVGTLGGTGTINATSLQASGGTITGSGTLNVSSGGTLGGNSMVITNSRTLSLGGSFNTVSGTSIALGNAARLMIASGGTLDVSDITFTFSGGTPAAFSNSGTLNVPGGSFVISGVPFTNSGSVTSDAGTLIFQGSSVYTQTAGSLFISNGSIVAANPMVINGGTLSGTGTITGSVNNTAGMVAPGVSPGTLTITGNYTQGAMGVLNIELGGTAMGQFDVLAITGSATLNGVLNISLSGGFVPNNGDSFTILTYGSRTGMFSAINGLNIGGGKSFQPNFNATNLTLLTVQTFMADLSVTKTDAPDPVLVNGTLTYTITVSNAGPDPAQNVVLTDTLPGPVTFVSASTTSGSPCTASGGMVSCSLGTVNVGAPVTATIQVTPLAAAVPQITNTASVTTTDTDPVAANNTASASTTVNPLANVSVTKTDAPDPVAATTNLTYTVTVTNGGPNSATGVVVTDTLPAGVTFVSATPPCAQAAGTVTCNLGTLANGASTVISIVVTPQPPVAGSTITNNVSVAANEADPNAANNTAMATTTVTAAMADLALTKADAPDPVVINSTLTYTLMVRNNGPQSATNVTVNDNLPAGVTFVSANSTQGSCVQSAGIICTIGTMANGATVTVTIVVRPTAAATLNNTATVTATEADPVAANNSASATTTVNAVPFTIDMLPGMPPNATIDSGQPAMFMFNVTPTTPGIAVVISCGGPLPPETTCTVTPPSFVASDTSPQKVTVNLQTTICILSVPPRPNREPRFPDGDIRNVWPLLFVMSLLFWVAVARRNEQLKRLTPVFALLMLAVLLSACASGSVGPAVKRTGPIGTLPGTYTIPINVTSGISTQSINFTLTVRQ